MKPKELLFSTLGRVENASYFGLLYLKTGICPSLEDGVYAANPFQ